MSRPLMRPVEASTRPGTVNRVSASCVRSKVNIKIDRLSMEQLVGKMKVIIEEGLFTEY